MAASVENRTFQLTVGRRDFLVVLKTVAPVLGHRGTEVRLIFQSGRLTLEARNTAAETHADGDWPPEVYVASTWVRRMAKSLPEGDPVLLAVRGERIRVNRYSEPCWFEQRRPPGQPSASGPEAAATAAEVARILRPLKLTERHIRELMREGAQRQAHPWNEDAPRMISLIAKAWVLLAPFGVEPLDIRRMVDRAIRDAWK